MAREVIVRLTDDFDRTQVADEVVKFVYEGVQYTLDLTTKNANEFRAYLDPYMEASHEAVRVTVAEKVNKAGGQLPTGRKAQLRSPEGEPTEVRDAIRVWANANGHEVARRGVVPQDIRDAYTMATGIPVGRNIKVRVDEVDTSGLDRLEQQDAAAGKPRHKPTATKAAEEPEPDPKEPDGPNSNGVTPAMREWAREHGYLTKGGYVKAEHRNEYHSTHVNDAAVTALEQHANANGARV